jgi:endo-1,4-beta-xylanase
MDVSVYTDSSSSYPTISPDLLTRQAARYKALFDVFVAHKSQLTSVTLWGLADDDTWLKTYPITRLDLPLLFDEQLQAKPAYWSLIGQTSPTGGTSVSPSRSSASASASASSSASASRSASSSASASQSASSSASSSPGTIACTVSYSVAGQWQDGFQGAVTVKNTGASAINGWTLTWTFANGQQITQLWNGSVVQSGANVTVTNAAWNGTIAPSATATFGFLASWTGSNTAPTTFAVNGHTC